MVSETKFEWRGIFNLPLPISLLTILTLHISAPQHFAYWGVHNPTDSRQLWSNHIKKYAHYFFSYYDSYWISIENPNKLVINIVHRTIPRNLMRRKFVQKSNIKSFIVFLPIYSEIITQPNKRMEITKLNKSLKKAVFLKKLLD